MGVGTVGLFSQITSSPAAADLTTTALPAETQLTASGAARNSIAVYGFENLSSDPENAYFSEGMTIY